MQPYDMVMLAILVVATLYGFWKGMAWQIAHVASLILSYVVALRFADQVAPHVSAPAPLNKFVAMLLIYLACSAGIWIVFQFVRNMLDKIHLREFDRQIGGLFGFFKGAIICTVITFFAVTLSASAREMVLQSKAGYYIAVFIHRATPVMPKEARDVLGPYIERLDRGLDPNAPPPQTVSTGSLIDGVQRITQELVPQTLPGNPTTPNGAAVTDPFGGSRYVPPQPFPPSPVGPPADRYGRDPNARSF